jgi:hypothetical protein
MVKPQTGTRNLDRGRPSRGERYATVCLSLNPSELPAPLLKRFLSLSASKIGSGDVKLASHVLVILNVSFRRRAGRLTPDVLLLKNPDVLAKPRCWGGESKR